MVIQQLLAEAGSAGTGRELVSVDARGAEAPADRASLRSPENYTSYGRTQNFVSPGGAVLGRRHAYTVPAKAETQSLGPVRGLDDREQATTLNTANGRIAYRFHARDLNLVMGPGRTGYVRAIPRVGRDPQSKGLSEPRTDGMYSAIVG